MTVLFAETAMLPEGWVRDVRVGIGADGRIASVESGVPARPDDVKLKGQALLPAMPNLHSHAFQRAMAGMTERRGESDDSFWTWRDLMYRFLDRLTPEQVQAIAAMVYVEMLEAGYASVGEFHYVHHQPGGAAYDDPAELSRRICAAASATGIGLTHLPVLYTYGGARQQPLSGGQDRFGNDLDGFLRLVESARGAVGDVAPDAVLGVAPHSLRATAPDGLRNLTTAVPDGPVHIHAAEQTREVEDIEAWLGARPIRFLLDEIGMDARWCAIHATHMNEGETADLARSGAVAGLCPITEANLGDGIFNGAGFVAAGGLYGIGSDSNIRISLCEELRSLEYSQRLAERARNVLAPRSGSTGEALYRTALAGGARALARDCSAIAVGAWADLVAVDRAHPVLVPLRDDQLLDGWIFAANDRVVAEVWSAGRHRVTGGRHVARESVGAAYRSAMAAILDNL